MSRRRPLPLGLLAVAVCALPLSACSGSGPADSASASARAAAIEPLPTRNPRAKAVEPIAGESVESARGAAAEQRAAAEPVPSGASAPVSRKAMKGRDTAPTGDNAVSGAEVLRNGIALPPIEAPDEVRRIIEAGNQIARTPYLWGGGHGKWLDTGYDCSGSISYALAAAGLLSGPLDSGRLMGWGKPGRGRWVTIYTNPGHVFMVVAGVRFDTSGTRATGSRWQSQMRSTGGFVARHPPGL